MILQKIQAADDMAIDLETCIFREFRWCACVLNVMNDDDGGLGTNSMTSPAPSGAIPSVLPRVSFSTSLHTTASLGNLDSSVSISGSINPLLKADQRDFFESWARFIDQLLHIYISHLLRDRLSTSTA